MKTRQTGYTWTAADKELIAELERDEAALPTDAPRALLSVRLSVLTDTTTSPLRQELDLRLLARERGYRVVGVARDLNVSATRVPPWRRPQLGPWLRDRAPDFDVLLFWKMDRLVRRVADLTTMITWCVEHGKNLVSRHDPVDLTTAAGKALASLFSAVAEIEAANTGIRVASLWNHAKTQSTWLVGKPAYGYTTTRNTEGACVLAIDNDARRALHWCRERILQEEGNPIRVAEEIFTAEQFQELQTALDRRAKPQPTRQPNGGTRFLGVLVCADCGTNMTAQKTKTASRSYEYLRCRACRGGGRGAPNPLAVYARLTDEVLSALGDEPVRVREYVGGQWVLTRTGMTFGQSWAARGVEEMDRDLVRAGVICEVTRIKVQKVRAPRVHTRLVIPADVSQRLVVTGEAFSSGVRKQ
ncbi:recombinase family protein [Streptomyces sp. NPDC096033]|uniref:recombinase family protein n=1 Tax=Streptomyces sp. NPDC096033 TaxID=3366071 RepID=UPI00381B374B